MNETTENTQTDETISESGTTSADKNEGAKTFTQDEVNKIVAKEKSKVKNQFKDYDTLAETVTKLQEELKDIREANKTLATRFTETVYTSSLESVAKDLNLDPELASKLIDKDKVIFVEDKPTNLKELIQATIEKHPQLVKKQVTTPEVPTVTNNKQTKFSLHKQTSNGFFNGGGLRINTAKEIVVKEQS